MPSITAIITTHNRVHLLPRALDSVLAQTLPADEIIVVDDGSTDETKLILHERYPGVRYLYQDNAGISTARNHAIRHASGDWLAFLDDDDSWQPEKLAMQMAAIKEQPRFRLCHTEEIWIRNGVRVNAMNKHRKQGGWIYPNCLPLCVISPSSVMIHRSVFETIGLFDESLPACEDYDLWLRICSQEPVLFIDTPLITKYGGHEDQLSRRHWGMDRFRISAMEKILASGQLNYENRRQTLNMLIDKIGIYINGVKKRGRDNEADEYQQRLLACRQQLDDLLQTSCC